ncbi:MAG: hypothetical protein WHU10_13015 [Fimbriimonadales bacterium]
MRTLAAALLAAALLAGCGGGESTELPKEKDQELRNNMSRSLTPEEIAKMGGGAPADGAKDAGPQAAPPPPGKGPR